MTLETAKGVISAMMVGFQPKTLGELRELIEMCPDEDFLWSVSLMLIDHDQIKLNPGNCKILRHTLEI